jgi:hypothetical protein
MDFRSRLIVIFSFLVNSTPLGLMLVARSGVEETAGAKQFH